MPAVGRAHAVALLDRRARRHRAAPHTGHRGRRAVATAPAHRRDRAVLQRPPAAGAGGRLPVPGPGHGHPLAPGRSGGARRRPDAPERRPHRPQRALRGGIDDAGPHGARGRALPTRRAQRAHAGHRHPRGQRHLLQPRRALAVLCRQPHASGAPLRLRPCHGRHRPGRSAGGRARAGLRARRRYRGRRGLPVGGAGAERPARTLHARRAAGAPHPAARDLRDLPLLRRPRAGRDLPHLHPRQRQPAAQRSPGRGRRVRHPRHGRARAGGSPLRRPPLSPFDKDPQ